MHHADSDLMHIAIRAAMDAGNSILDVYNHQDIQIDTKSDLSPVTNADLKAHDIISQQLLKTGIPVLSEEGTQIPYDERKNVKKIWIVDPLDGTKEFIKRNGEFTVNIALIEDHQPVLGVIYAPVLNELYYASAEKGSFKLNLSPDQEPDFNQAIKLPVSNIRKRWIVAGSRSHFSKETAEYIDQLEKKHEKVEILSRGSSLKLCLVAEGAADVYPRFGPTSEWDIAAGHAVCRFAGAEVYDAITCRPLTYNKENILNPSFVAMKTR